MLKFGKAVQILSHILYCSNTEQVKGELTEKSNYKISNILNFYINGSSKILRIRHTWGADGLFCGFHMSISLRTCNPSLLALGMICLSGTGTH